MTRAAARPVGRGGADGPVGVVHRTAAVAVALVLAVFGVLGFVGGLAFFSTAGSSVLGLSSNGLLSLLSVVTAALLVGAAVRGARLASTVMLVVGVAFLVSAFANLALLGTALNVLAFRLPNVFFAVVVGLLLLILGSYGRVSSKLPVDNPYYQRRHRDDPPGAPYAQPRPRSNAEAVADREMAAAERHVVARTRGGSDQSDRIRAMRHLRSHEERRTWWMNQGPSSPADAPPDRPAAADGGRTP